MKLSTSVRTRRLLIPSPAARSPLRSLGLALLLACLGALSLAPTAGAAKALGDGAWSFFGDPRAVHRNGKTYVGWITSGGRVQVSRYDHATRTRKTVTLRNLGVDDHNNPSVVFLPDGRVRAFFSPHSGRVLPVGQPSRLYYRTTANPYGIYSWTGTRSIPTNTSGGLGYTYPNPVQLGNTTYLFWRGGNWFPTFSTSRDDGRNWSRARTLVRGPSGERPYAKYAGDGRDTIHVAYTEGHPSSIRTGIYYLRHRGGGFYRADGSLVGRMSDLPIAYRRGDRVYNYRSGNGRAWILDVAQDGGGRPVIVYQRREAGDVYRYARWNGRRWEDHRIAAAGTADSDYYTGGATLDHEDPSVVYLSRRIDGTHEVEVRATADGGRTWASEAVTRDSRQGNIRPISPRGLVSGSLILWMRGDYVGWTEYSTSIVAQAKDQARAVAARR